jgi:lysophospholipase L1-like esterase
MAASVREPARSAGWTGHLFAGVAATWAAGSLFVFLLAPPEPYLALVPVSAAAIALAPRFTRFRWAFAVIAAGLVAGLLLLEVAIRLLVFGPAAILRPLDYGPKSVIDSRQLVLVDDADLVFALRPGYHGRYMGRDLIVNSGGLRGPEVNPAGRPGVLRLMAFGTSITMGAGVDIEDAYPAVTARILRDRGIAAEGIDAAIPGYATSQIFAFAERELPTYRPDIVVVEIHPAMLTEAPGTDPRIRAVLADPPRDPSFIERSSFAAAALYPAAGLRDRLLEVLRRQAPAVGPAGTDTAYVEGRIRALARSAEGLHARLVVLFIPPMQGVGARDPLAPLRARVTRTAIDAGALVVNGYPLFPLDELGDDLLVFPGDLHPNATAHKRLAAALADAIATATSAR